jgi:hypothetical protein
MTSNFPSSENLHVREWETEMTIRYAEMTEDRKYKNVIFEFANEIS